MAKQLLILSLLLAALSSTAYAVDIPFVDGLKYWPGWHNGQSSDNKDIIGIPDFIGGTVTVQNGYLQRITFNYKADRYLSVWGELTPSDLFIDLGADNEWNYIVNTRNQTGHGDYNLFSVNGLSATKGSNDSLYVLSGQDNTGSWYGDDIRDNHPIGVMGLTGSSQTVYFSGWERPSQTGQIVTSYFDFTNFYIGSQDFIISWTANCANDVVYERIQTPGEIQVTPHAPEPASMFLLGSGLIGIAVYVRRKFPHKASSN